MDGHGAAGGAPLQQEEEEWPVGALVPWGAVGWQDHRGNGVKVREGQHQVSHLPLLGEVPPPTPPPPAAAAADLGPHQLEELLVGRPILVVHGSIDEEVDAVLDPVDHIDDDAEGHVYLVSDEGLDVVDADGDDAGQEEQEESQEEGRGPGHIPGPHRHQTS